MNAPPMAMTLLALCALIAVSNCRANDYASPKDEIAAAVTWYDSVQWPDVRGLPYMEFTLAVANDEIKWWGHTTLRGFLLSEDDQAYHAFCNGVTLRIFKKNPDGKPGMPASARELGPTSAVDDEIADLRRPKGEDLAISMPVMRSEWIDTYTHIFVLARCFARQGRADLTEKLDKALALALAKRSTSRVSQDPNFRVAIERWLFGNVILESTRDFGDLSVPRLRLLEEFERIARGFPRADRRGVAREIADRLRAMIAEDEAHAKSAKALEAMSLEEKVAESIFRLRDENGLQESIELRADRKEPYLSARDPLGPVSVSVGDAPSPFSTNDSPARQLIQLGPAAVPALIAALDDPRLTRSVEIHPGIEEFGPDLDPSSVILTVGECAESILFYISGRHFGGSRRNTASPGTIHSSETTRANAQQWWSDWQAKGEKQVLTEGVQRGDQESLAQARHLVALDAAAAVQTIAAGIAAAKTAEIRTDLIRELGAMQTAAATRTLRHEMKNNPHPYGRIAAAVELSKRGENDAVPSMIAEWVKWKPSIYEEPGDGEDGVVALIDFLSSCGQTDALHALAHRFPSLPTETKFLILGAYATMDRHEAGTDRKPLPTDFVKLHEDFIVKALDDHTRHLGMGWETQGDGVKVFGPRVCDMAAVALTHRWPVRYTFKWKKTRAERDLEIAQMRNTWRASRGLSPLPVPTPPPINAIPAEKDRNTVASCQWFGGPPLPDVPISVGQPLTGAGITQALYYLHRHVPRDCFGFAFSAERDRGKSGIVVEIEWLPGPRPESPSREKCWGDLWVNDQTTFILSWRDGPKDSAESKGNSEQTVELNHSLANRVDQPFSLNLYWLWERQLLPSPMTLPVSLPLEPLK